MGRVVSGIVWAHLGAIGCIGLMFMLGSELYKMQGVLGYLHKALHAVLEQISLTS